MARNKKKLNSSGAYTVLVDDRRLIEGAIGKQVQSNPGIFKTQKTGLYLTESDESLPIYGPMGASTEEKVISRKNLGPAKPQGSRIVLTKDNYGHRATGLGGNGGTMCEAIDIVAGSLTCEKGLKTVETQSRANFITDGARIYLTERGDIQHYFAVGSGGQATSITSNLKSGIGIKADHTLVIGRERVRILVGFSKAVGQERLANYQKRITPKIELAQIGDEETQPAVLGNNLIKFLKEQSKQIQTLRNKILSMEFKLVRYKTAMALHSHTGFGLGVVQTLPSPSAAKEGATSIAEFLETTTDAIISTYKQQMKNYKALGTENGVLMGTPSDRLLSSTVYIGK